MPQSEYPIPEEAPKTVKDFDADDQPREKAMKYGIQSLTNAECLALILRIGTPGNPITRIARDLMKRNDNKFLNLERMSDMQLRQTPGIGPVKVLELRAIMEIMRRYASENIGDRPQISTSNDIYNYFRYQIANLPHEEFWALFMNNSNKVLSRFKMSEGGSVATVYDNKKILKQALLQNAEAIALCHNHPSGVLRPSVQDQQITNSFASACKIMNFRFIDHVIVSTEGYYSFHDNGKM